MAQVIEYVQAYGPVAAVIPVLLYFSRKFDEQRRELEEVKKQVQHVSDVVDRVDRDVDELRDKLMSIVKELGALREAVDVLKRLTFSVPASGERGNGCDKDKC